MLMCSKGSRPNHHIVKYPPFDGHNYIQFIVEPSCGDIILWLLSGCSFGSNKQSYSPVYGQVILFWYMAALMCVMASQCHCHLATTTIWVCLQVSFLFSPIIYLVIFILFTKKESPCQSNICTSLKSELCCGILFTIISYLCNFKSFSQYITCIPTDGTEV